MVRTCVDPYFGKIKEFSVVPGSDPDLWGSSRACAELRFLKMILWCFATRDVDIHAENTANFISVLSTIEGIWKNFGQRIADNLPEQKSTSSGFEPTLKGLYLFFSDLEESIQQSKTLLENFCEDLLHGSLRCKPTASDEMVDFLDVVLLNLKGLERYKAGRILPEKTQFEALKRKLVLSRNFFKLTVHGCIDCKELRDFKRGLHTLANDAACLAFLYWVKEADEGIRTKSNLMLSDMLQKIIKPDVSALSLRGLKAIKLQRSDDTLLLGQTVANFVDLLLENTVASLQNDTQVLRDGLIFLLTFLADPPKKHTQDEDVNSRADPPKQHREDEDRKSPADPPQECAKDENLILICNQIDVLLQQASYLICPSDDMKADPTEEKVLLNDILDKTEVLKENIKVLYVEISCLYSSHFPTVNGLGFFDRLLQNIGNINEKIGEDALFIPFAKNYIFEIEKGLVTLRPLLEMLKEQHDMKDTWLEAIVLAYRTELIINSCSVILHPIWYSMTCLAYILDKIEVVGEKLEQLKDCKVYNTGVLPSSSGSISKFSKKTLYSGTNEIVVGFGKDAKIITDKLIGGYKSFDVISIVGMGGQGKTTLAMKVFNDKLVRCHFHILAFCSVSEVYNGRKLLLDILSDMIVIDNRIRSMEKDDLAHQLWKCLSGQRYLIVLDDIWEITAWDDVKNSFPDKGNGSRVILTTRSDEVALKAKINSSPHHLCFLSDDESWDLLQKKTFGTEVFPPDLSQTGMKIAKNCKGLPLAIVVIGGLLAREQRNEKFWKEIEGKTASYASKEGCKDVLELSYKHLPEHLKSCLLYFGMFLENELIPAKRLLLLWIGEGFIKKSEGVSLQNSAMECLCDLVDRNLIIVARESFRAGIKKCYIHDLVHDMCQSKAQEENFFHFIHGAGNSSSSNSVVCTQYRSCIQMSWVSFMRCGRTGPNTHSLLCCPKYEGYSKLNFMDTLATNEDDTLATNEDEQRILVNSKLVQVLDVVPIGLKSLNPITSLVHLRYIAIEIDRLPPIPSSISYLWNLEILILNILTQLYHKLPRAMADCKRLSHLDVGQCMLGFNYPQLNNVESFSVLSLWEQTATENLQRLPNVRKLSCAFLQVGSGWNESLALDFLCQLESLKLRGFMNKNPYVIFPSTLKKLSLSYFSDWRGIPAIAKLPKLEALKMINYRLSKWEVEDEDFPNLKFLKLSSVRLKHWNASMESFPCLERLVLDYCVYPGELPACFKESSTLKRIEVHGCGRKAVSSAVEIQKEQMDLGNEEFELLITEAKKRW